MLCTHRNVVRALQCCRRLCAASTIQRPEYSVVCLGLDGAGKSTILATLSNEDTAVQSTTGYHSTVCVLRPLPQLDVSGLLHAGRQGLHSRPLDCQVPS